MCQMRPYSLHINNVMSTAKACLVCLIQHNKPCRPLHTVLDALISISWDHSRTGQKLLLCLICGPGSSAAATYRGRPGQLSPCTGLGHLTRALITQGQPSRHTTNQIKLFSQGQCSPTGLRSCTSDVNPKREKTSDREHSTSNSASHDQKISVSLRPRKQRHTNPIGPQYPTGFGIRCKRRGSSFMTARKRM